MKTLVIKSWIKVKNTKSLSAVLAKVQVGVIDEGEKTACPKTLFFVLLK